MKIIIFGSNGMLGNYVKTYLTKHHYEIICLTRDDYDLSNISFESLDTLLIKKNIMPNDVIINCAGIIPQSSNQHTLVSSLYFKINSLFPVILSSICNKYSAKMIHITTDCVFSGKDGNYCESSIHDETSDYGLSKSLGELCDATIIRTSIIGEELLNKRSLLEWTKSNANKEINGYVNHYWNGVTCLELSKIIYKIINENIYWKTPYHLFSPTSVTKYELVSLINEIYNLNINIHEFNDILMIDKTLTTNNQPIIDIFNIQELKQQIIEMKNYNF